MATPSLCGVGGFRWENPAGRRDERVQTKLLSPDQRASDSRANDKTDGLDAARGFAHGKQEPRSRRRRRASGRRDSIRIGVSSELRARRVQESKSNWGSDVAGPVLRHSVRREIRTSRRSFGDGAVRCCGR
jgi:hypothetical protein